MLSGNNYLRQLLALTVLFFSLAAQAQVDRYVEGVHYTVLPALTYARTLDNTDNKVDVMEIFWYGCSHCYAFDPVLESWAQAHAANINFSRSPLMVWNEMNKQHARLFFAMQQLGKGKELHSIIFDEVQQRGNLLTDAKTGATLFEGHGVSAADFAGAYNSFAVDTLLRKTETMQKEMRVASVPILIVNGKYMVEGNSAVPAHEDMLKLVEFLINKEQPAS